MRRLVPLKVNFNKTPWPPVALVIMIHWPTGPSSVCPWYTDRLDRPLSARDTLTDWTVLCPPVIHWPTGPSPVCPWYTDRLDRPLSARDTLTDWTVLCPPVIHWPTGPSSVRPWYTDRLDRPLPARETMAEWTSSLWESDVPYGPAVCLLSRTLWRGMLSPRCETARAARIVESLWCSGGPCHRHAESS